MTAAALVKRGKRVGRRIEAQVAGQLVWNKADAEPALGPLIASMTDEQARLHFGAEEQLDAEHLRRVIRYFHAWRVATLRRRLGERLDGSRVLDVGDTDGLMLKHLGKQGIGLNLSEAALRNIRANGIEARAGDCHSLPFGDAEFDVVLCFETLEHVESPYQVLLELARVCKTDGRVFVSIPWVPRTAVQPRDPTYPRGAMHVFELARDDFAALVSHTPLQLVWEDVCEVIGRPHSLVQRLFQLLWRDAHIVAGTFRRFQFFELAPSPR